MYQLNNNLIDISITLIFLMPYLVLWNCFGLSSEPVFRFILHHNLSFIIYGPAIFNVNSYYELARPRCFAHCRTVQSSYNTQMSNKLRGITVVPCPIPPLQYHTPWIFTPVSTLTRCDKSYNVEAFHTSYENIHRLMFRYEKSFVRRTANVNTL